MLPDELDDNFILRRGSRAIGGEEWLLSYSDVVTLLLCFFIMFVHFKEEAITSGDFELKAAIGGGSQLVPTISPEMSELLEKMDEKFNELKILEHKRERSAIVVYLNEGGLFSPGGFEANPEMLKKLGPIVEMLRPHADKVHVEIQGYADATPVRAGHGRAYKTNLELSVLRALAVLRDMQDRGMPEAAMAVTGFGEHRQLGVESVENIEKLARNRRVSLRITPRE